MSHEHCGHCCEHKAVKFCKICKVVFCLDCKKEWRDNPFYYSPWTYPYTVTTSPPNITYTVSGATTDAVVVGPCNH